MNLFKKHCLIDILFSIAFLILFSLVYFAAFPPAHWDMLWKSQIGHLPFILIVPILTLAGGLIAGLISGYLARNSLNQLDDAISELIHGNSLTDSELPSGDESRRLHEKLKKLSAQMSLQTALVQKLTNESAQLEEQAVQQVISEERNRLARELHDSVSQQLFGASMLMSTINQKHQEENDPETRQLRLVEQAIQQSQLEMRALFLHLRPVQLHGKALKDGIAELLGELKMKVPMQIHWSLDSVSLEKGIEDQLFRILQESVSNVLRHSKAKKLDVRLLAPPHRVILRVTDDGTGFDARTNKPGSYGLANMRERAGQIGAHLKIVSIAGGGTSLEVNVPIITGGGKTND